VTAAKLSVNPLLDKNFINCFVDAVGKTLRTTASTTAQAQKPKIENQASPSGDVMGVIGLIAGPVRGTLTLTFSKEAIFEVLKNMFGETHSEINNEVSDAVGELTNQIYGTAKTELNKMGYQFDAAIPTVVSGSFQMRSYHKGATLVIPFTTAENKVLSLEITVQV
jgi:chemotaxis protein CheX